MDQSKHPYWYKIPISILIFIYHNIWIFLWNKCNCLIRDKDIIYHKTFTSNSVHIPRNVLHLNERRGIVKFVVIWEKILIQLWLVLINVFLNKCQIYNKYWIYYPFHSYIYRHKLPFKKKWFYIFRIIVG